MCCLSEMAFETGNLCGAYSNCHSLWKLIFVRSNGAIVVLATAPATAPAASDVIILYGREICYRNNAT